MPSDNQKISTRQMQILLVINAFGTGFIALPRHVAAYAGAGGWVLVAILTAVAALLAVLMITAARRIDGPSFMAYASRVFSRPLAWALGAGLWARLIAGAGLEARAFMEITRVFLLPATPGPVVVGVLLFVCAYTAAQGIEARARVAEILLVILLAVFLFLTLVALSDLDFSNLRPFDAPPRRWAAGTLALGCRLTGLECLLLLPPFLHKENPRRPVTAAIACAGGVILLVTAQTIAKFGADEVVRQRWPVMRMMDMLTFPGSFIAWQNAFIMSFWIITVFALCNAFLFYGAALARDMAGGRGTHRVFVWVCAGAALGVACLPGRGTRVFAWLEGLYVALGIFYMLIFPLALLGLAALRKIKKAPLCLCAGLCLLGLTGCWDRVEIEDRAFVMGLAVDKAAKDDLYTVYATIPVLKRGGKETSGNALRKASGKTVTEALHALDAQTPQKLFISHAKVLVLGDALIGDAAMLRDMLDALDQNPEMDRKILVLTGDAEETLREPEDESATMPGLAFPQIFKLKNKASGISFKQDFASLCADVRGAGGGLLPAALGDKLSGAAVLKDGQKRGQLSQAQLRGYLWGRPRACEGAVLTADADGRPLSMTVTRHRVKLRFTEAEGQVRGHMDVTVKGRLSGPLPDAETAAAERAFARLIGDEIRATTEKFREEYQVDGYGFLDALRKKRYALYRKYAQDADRAFLDMDTRVNVTVTVEG